MHITHAIQSNKLSYLVGLHPGDLRSKKARIPSTEAANEKLSNAPAFSSGILDCRSRKAPVRDQVGSRHPALEIVFALPPGLDASAFQEEFAKTAAAFIERTFKSKSIPALWVHSDLGVPARDAEAALTCRMQRGVQKGQADGTPT